MAIAEQLKYAIYDMDMAGEDYTRFSFSGSIAPDDDFQLNEINTLAESIADNL